MLRDRYGFDWQGNPGGCTVRANCKFDENGYAIRGSGQLVMSKGRLIGKAGVKWWKKKVKIAKDSRYLQ